MKLVPFAVTGPELIPASRQSATGDRVIYSAWPLLSAWPAVYFPSRRYYQGDHLSGKPGNVREFETCQGNVRDVVNSREMSGKNLVMEKCPKTVHY